MTHVIVGTAGHIDHGKTSLVKLLTGTDTDRLPEEKARGISIDLGFAHWEAGTIQFGIVDVPGHERFVRNMVAGSTGVDLALLVVAADDGVMPQTREHVEIMDLLGVATGAVALTKTDLVEAEMIDLVREDISALTRGTFLEGCPIVPVSSVTGAGIDGLKETLLRVATACHWVPRSELFRMPIDRVFSVAGHGTVVTGTALGGEVRAGDVLELLPAQQNVRVRGVQNHNRQSVDSGARQRTAINLAGVKTADVERGCELAAAGYLHPSQRLLVSLRCLAGSPVALKDRMHFNLHIGTREVAARLIMKGQILEPAGRGYAELRVASPIVAAYGQRFILRRHSPAVTVGGGMILDPGIPPRLRIRDLQACGSVLDQADELGRLSAYLAGQDVVDISPLPAAWKTGVPPGRYAGCIRELVAQHALVQIGARDVSRLVHRQRLETLAASAMKRIRAELVRQQPRRALSRRTILATCQKLASAELLEAAVGHLLATGHLVPVGPLLGPADAQVQLSKNQIALRAKILESITHAGLAPPTVKELVAALGQRHESVVALIELCVQDGLLTEVGAGLFYTYAAVDEARVISQTTLARLGQATLSQLREAWSVTRKHAIPLGEFLDKRQITLRTGDLRSAGPNLGVRLIDDA